MIKKSKVKNFKNLMQWENEMLYRILTESGVIPETKMNNLIQHWFDSYTSYVAIGYWNGIREGSLVVEIATDNECSIMALADAIRRASFQQCVMVQKIECVITMVKEKTNA